MPTILDISPIEVIENLRLLSQDLDAKIPSKKLDKNLLIATWNIRAFGDLTRKWDSVGTDSPKEICNLYCALSI